MIKFNSLILFFGFANAFFFNKPVLNFFKINTKYESSDSKFTLVKEYYQFLNDYDIIKIDNKIFSLNFFGNVNNKLIEERLENYKIFENNYRLIQDFNSANNSFKLGLNQFADTIDMNNADDLMYNEIKDIDIFKNDVIGIKQIIQDPQYYIDKYRNLLPELIWNQSILSHVKNQGRCGSCWAFSTTGALEAKMRINNYKVDRLSEQELVDCSKQNYGCNGGLMHLAFDYCIENHGLTSNQEYNYTAKNGHCLYNCNLNNTESQNFIKVLGSFVKDYKFTIPRSVIDLKASLKEGPICIALDASPLEFRFYKEGVIDIENRNTSRINHAVLLTGYSEYQNGSYWIIQNSWGTSWGYNGYAKIKIENGDGVLLSQLYGVYPYI